MRNRFSQFFLQERRLFLIFTNRTRIMHNNIFGHIVYPIRTLMSKDQRFITMEVINNMIILRLPQHWNTGHIVVPYAANDDIGFRRIGPNDIHRMISDLIPRVCDPRRNDFVQQFECDRITVGSVTLGNPIPHGIKPFLQIFIKEKFFFAFFFLQWIKSIAVCIMHIQKQIQSGFSGPLDRMINVGIACFNCLSVRCFNQCVIYRQSHMVQF